MKNLITGALALCLSLSGAQALAQDTPSFTENVEGLNRQDGLIALYPDAAKGRVLAALSPQDDGTLGRMIYTARLTSGLGSNPVGLDRGLGSDTYILRFSRVGDAVFAEFENTRYAALGAGADEQAATAPLRELLGGRRLVRARARARAEGWASGQIEGSAL